MSPRRSTRAAAKQANKALADQSSQRNKGLIYQESDDSSAADFGSSTTDSEMSSRGGRRGHPGRPKQFDVNPRKPAAPKPAPQIPKRERFVGGEILEGKRPRAIKKSYVLESESEEEDDEMEDVGDEDAEGESIDDEEEEEDEGEDDDAEGEPDDDAEGDVDMDAPPPLPVIKVSKAQSGKTSITIKSSSKNNTTVVATSVNEASDDEELSDLDSEIAEDVEVEVEDEDAEGEEEDLEEAEDVDIGEEDEEEEGDSDDIDGSRSSSPDLNKLTKRQRARLEDGGDGGLLALPDEVQVKKHLTVEEHAMRRAEMARRRKNLSEKRNEEEKMETINKLLKKQAPKTNARRKDLAQSSATEATPEDLEAQKPNGDYVRWVSSKDGNRLFIPDAWIAGPAGEMFRGSIPAGTGMGQKLIEEVE